MELREGDVTKGTVVFGEWVSVLDPPPGLL